jgi:chromosome segregation ATPase
MDAAVKMTEETDALQALEERILKAVELVETLRKERDSALAELEEAKKTAGVDQQKLRKELDELKAERKQVRSRIEKLLTQVDSLS